MICLRRLCFAALAVSVLGATLVSAASDRRRSSNSTPAPASTSATVSPSEGFDAFQLVVERNIFNPNRVGRTRAAPEEKPPRIDEISLVGTMNYDKGLLAFFDSPDDNFRKAVREGESVGEFKVQRISAEGVELLRADKPLTVKIAQQLRRQEGGEWSVRTTPVAIPNAPKNPDGSVAALPAEPAAEAEIPADASEVMKRLMKRREKQLK